MPTRVDVGGISTIVDTACRSGGMSTRVDIALHGGLVGCQLKSTKLLKSTLVVWWDVD